MNSIIGQNWDPFKKNKREALIKKMVLKRLGDEIRPISYQKFVFGSFRMWQKHYQNKAIYWRETLKMSILEQNAEIVPGAFLSRFLGRFFCCKLELFWASRRFSLLQTLCARRYEKRTQQAELVGKNQKQI